MNKTLIHQLTVLLTMLLFLSCQDKNEENIIRETNIEGKWKVIETSFSYFEHPSECNSLGINSIFEFDNGNFKIYKDESSGNCLTYPQTYKIDSTTIWICEIDMVFDYKIIKMTHNELILNSSIIVPRSLFDKHISDDTDLVSRLSRDGITIKMRRL
jgi:hypothetical protein